MIEKLCASLHPLGFQSFPGDPIEQSAKGRLLVTGRTAEETFWFYFGKGALPGQDFLKSCMEAEFHLVPRDEGTRRGGILMRRGRRCGLVVRPQKETGAAGKPRGT